MTVGVIGTGNIGRAVATQATDMGVDLFPVLAALVQWGDRWLGPAGVEMQHRGCGGAVRAELRCDKGHSLAVGDIDLVARPETAS